MLRLVSLVALLPLFVGTAFAHVGVLECRFVQLDKYRESCQSDGECGVFGASEAFSAVPMDWIHTLERNDCIKERVKSCTCLTYLGGRYFRENDFDWSAFAIHGHYCGWRSGHRADESSPLNWRDWFAVRFADLATPGVDRLDEVCRVHDIDYDEPGMDICEADLRAMRALVSLALDSKNGFSNVVREKSLILAGALRMNRYTCHLLTLLKKQSFHGMRF